MKLNIISIMDETKSDLVEVQTKTMMRKLKYINYRLACKPGCHGCCSRMIYISIAESIIIRDNLVKAGLWKEIYQTCKKYEQDFGDYDPDTWFLSNIKCPILDPKTNLCRTQKVKPVMCTIHHAIDNARACDPWDLSGFQPNFLDFEDIAKEFYHKMNKRYQDHIYNYRIPLVKGLVLAESIYMQEGMDLESVLKKIAVMS